MSKDLVTIELDKYKTLLKTIEQIEEFKSNDDYLVLEYWGLAVKFTQVIKNKEAAIEKAVYAKEQQMFQKTYELEKRVAYLENENIHLRQLKTPDKPWYKRLFKKE